MLRKNLLDFLSFAVLVGVILSLGNNEVFASDPPWFQEAYYDKESKRDTCGPTPFSCKKGSVSVKKPWVHPPGSYLWECRGKTFIQTCAAPTEGCAIKPMTAPPPKCDYSVRDAHGYRKPYLCAVGLPSPQPSTNTSYKWRCYNARGVNTQCGMSFY